MKMYICMDCGGVMDEKEALRFMPEVHDELPERPTEWVSEERCIYCDSEDLERAEMCSFCGEYKRSLDINYYGMCKDCEEKELASIAGGMDMLLGFAKEYRDAFLDYVLEHKKKTP